MLKHLKTNHINASIFLVWLFHVSAIIGISLGFQSWFVSKTPLNLIVQATLLWPCFSINTKKKWLVFAICFLTGMMVEAIGVQHNFLFGSYYYGDNLGFKILEVPLLIGVNWAILVFITGVIASHLSNNIIAKIVIGATLMVGLDFFLEAVAPTFDFWYFTDGHPPLRNYITWFLVAAFLHFIFQYLKINGNIKFCFHLYLAQLVFFTYFKFYL